MEPTNNPSKHSLMSSVIVTKTRHSFKTEDGMSVFGILMTCVMTWRGRQNVCQIFRDLLSGTVGATRWHGVDLSYVNRPAGRPGHSLLRFRSVPEWGGAKFIANASDVNRHGGVAEGYFRSALFLILANLRRYLSSLRDS